MNEYIDYKKLYKKITFRLKEIENYFEKQGEGIDGSNRTLIETIEYGVCINGLCILINIFENNIDSIGLAVDVRQMIEGFSLLKALADDVLNDKQIALAIYSYLYCSTQKHGFVFNYETSDDLDGLAEDISKLLGISKKEAIKLFHKQFSFLAFNDKTKNMTISQFIKQMMGEGLDDERAFLSFNIHPSCYSEKIEKKNNKLMVKCIRSILISLYYFYDKLDLKYEEMPSYEEMRALKITKEIDTRINTVQEVFTKVFSKSDNCFEGDECTTYVFEKVKRIIIDIDLCSSFLTLEDVSNRYKLIYEYLSMYYFVKKSDCFELWKKMSDYNISSVCPDDFCKEHEELLNTIARSVKSKYSLSLDVNVIKKNLKNNSLFFLFGDINMTYMKMVKTAIDEAYQIKEIKDRAYQLYRYSLDDTHAGFALGRAIVKIDSNNTKRSYYDYIINYVYSVFYYCESKAKNEDKIALASLIYSMLKADK